MTGMVDPFAVIRPQTPAHDWLRFGEVKPAGWLRQQMQHDLEQGFLGCLDDLVPGLICDDDIYGRDRRTMGSRHQDLGTIADDESLRVQYMWWNSETQSNWWDGVVRAALLLDHGPALERVTGYVNRMLANQDDDGYLGIYAPDLRFAFRGENGELWAQATLFRALLAYYEATGEPHVLTAVERAARVTMTAYPPGRSQPFPAETSMCGDSHGLVITDALERLGQLTGDPSFTSYAAWLYEAFSKSRVSLDDAQYRHLVDPDYRFRQHGVHTYEHLRPLLLAVFATGNPALRGALAGYLAKLDRCLAPSGGPIGDEFIEGRDASAGETGYEYCSIHELLDSYTHLLQKTGAPDWGDRTEWLLFNAGQGARHPGGCGITYLRTDNSVQLTGPLHPGDPPTHHGPQTRYKYSPVHQDVAVCCAPNAGRIYPYYVRSMWMRSAEGLVATLYGPCELKTDVEGSPVRIRETTNYPFDLAVVLTVETDRPTEFELALRVPRWAEGYTLGGAEDYAEHEGFVRIRRCWSGASQITLNFQASARVHPWADGGAYLSHGPLVFALPLVAEPQPGREYGRGFCDLRYTPAADAVPALALPPRPAFTLARCHLRSVRAVGFGRTGRVTAGFGNRRGYSRASGAHGRDGAALGDLSGECVRQPGRTSPARRATPLGKAWPRRSCA